MANPPRDPVSGLPYYVQVGNDRIASGAGRDAAFDPYLNLSPELQEAVFLAVESVLNQGRTRARRPDDRYNASRVLGCVIANAIIALRRGPRTGVHYSRGKATYAGPSPYQPAWLTSKLLRQVVDQLRAGGLV